MTAQAPKPCPFCKGTGIVLRVGWDGEPDEDWCDCPAAEAYRSEIDTREPATTF